jgi:hypothetical protein
MVNILKMAWEALKLLTLSVYIRAHKTPTRARPGGVSGEFSGHGYDNYRVKAQRPGEEERIEAWRASVNTAGGVTLQAYVPESPAIKDFTLGLDEELGAVLILHFGEVGSR